MHRAPILSTTEIPPRKSTPPQLVRARYTGLVLLEFHSGVPLFEGAQRGRHHHLLGTSTADVRTNP
jgi:hypothetical protein